MNAPQGGGEELKEPKNNRMRFENGLFLLFSKHFLSGMRDGKVEGYKEGGGGGGLKSAEERSGWASSKKP